MNLRRIDYLLLISIPVALVANLASAFLVVRFPEGAYLATLALAVAVAVWFLFRAANTILGYIRYGRYAVLIFFLGPENRLLLIRHPFHEVLLPPGGRLQQWELPHYAVANRLREETGIERFEFHPAFHNKDLMMTEIVEDVPRPFSVHMEHRTQRGGIRFHYAFVYVCRFAGEVEALKNIEGYQPRWMTLAEIKALGKDLRPFDDIIRQYEIILDHLAAMRA